jgi:hypothetical protein
MLSVVVSITISEGSIALYIPYASCHNHIKIKETSEEVSFRMLMVGMLQTNWNQIKQELIAIEIVKRIRQETDVAV